MMASLRESDNSRFIHGSKRMRISEEKGGDIFQTNSSTSKEPCPDLLALTIGPWRGDCKKKVMDAGKKGESGSGGDHSNWLRLSVGSSMEDEPRKYIYDADEARDADKKGESTNKEVMDTEKKDATGSSETGPWREDGSKKDIYGKGKVMDAEEKGDAGSSGLYTDCITNRSCSSIEDGSTKYIYGTDDLCREDDSIKEMWLVMDLYDETSGFCKGFTLFDISRRFSFRNTFDNEWRCRDLQWFLRAGDGGLLVYSSKINGTVRVINPLTMQFHCLEDAKVTGKSRISFYMKKYPDDVAVHLMFDSKENTYQVTVVIGNIYLVRRNELFVLIYRSAGQRWEIRRVHLAEKVKGGLSISGFPRIFVQNLKIYCFSKDGAGAGTYDLNADINSKFRYILGMQGIMHRPLGIVMYKGRIIMVCQSKATDLPPHTHALVFYEFDELRLCWRSKHEAVVLRHSLPPSVICCGGDFIWVIDENDGQGSNIICIDIDAGELKVFADVSKFISNVRNCMLMRCRSQCP